VRTATHTTRSDIASVTHVAAGAAPWNQPTHRLVAIAAIARNHAFNVLRLLLIPLLCALSPLALADRQQDPELGKLLTQALQAGECFEDKFDQQVWLAAMEPQLKGLLKDTAERAEVLHYVHCEAKRLKLPPGLVMAVIDVESRFDRWAVSSAGAVGLMQVMPFWPRQLGMTNAELVRTPQNVRMGCTILKFYLDREKGDYARALARYNGSTGKRDYSDLVLARLSRKWSYR
jgi:soluble lytic murein transglycosylase-like protein